MSDRTLARLEMLERTVLELGAEVFNLRGTIGKVRENHDHFLATVRGLKQLLDDKGLITAEDFDAAIDLGHAIESLGPQGINPIIEQSGGVKKTGH